MNGSAYYEFQTKARGLNSETDVLFLAEYMSVIYRRAFSKWLPIDRKAAIYEVACGPGVFLRHLIVEGYSNIHGSDSSECQIKLTQSLNASVTLGDSIKELEQHPKERWDCIVAIDFIEHLPKDILIDFLAECSRTLKPGGRLIMRAPNGDSPFVGRNLYNDITHFWAYTTISLTALCQMAGFKQVEFSDEAIDSIQKLRFVKVPLMKASQSLIRFLIRSATREDIRYLSPSIFIAATK